MAVLHFEDGYSKEYITKNGTTRLHGIKRNGTRPILIELSQKEWDNKEFHYRWAEHAKHPSKGKVVLNKELI